MRKTLVVSFVALAVITPTLSSGEESEATALSQRLFKALKIEEAFSRQREQQVLAEIQANQGMSLYEDVIRRYYEEHVGWKAVSKRLTQRYTEEFTVEELRGLVAFFESPLGMKSTEQVPAIGGRVAREGLEALQANASNLQKMLDAKAEILNMK